MPSAAALEMLHNAFLVHDDVEDGSELRRNHPTMVAEHGVPLAVNTGDAMNALSIRLLRRNLPLLGAPTAIRIYEEIDALLMESLEGQAMEFGWIRDNDTRVSASDYLRMTLKKTCLYSFIHPMRIGALVADGERTDLRSLRQARLLHGHRIPDPGRCAELDRRPPLWQGNRRRPDGRQALLDSGAPLRPCLRRTMQSVAGLPRPSASATAPAGDQLDLRAVAPTRQHRVRTASIPRVGHGCDSASLILLSPERRTRKRSSSSAEFSTSSWSAKPEKQE